MLVVKYLVPVAGMEACAAAVEVGAAIEPSAGATAYEEAYSVYRDLYPDLRGSFGRLSGLDE